MPNAFRSQAIGFRELLQHGSYKRFSHPDELSTTVPVHGSRDIHPDLLRLIARDAGLTIREFIARR